MPSPTPRVVCERCRRPATVCYCAHVTRLETRTRVLLLQHPREREVGIGTARIARLCLPAADLRVGVDFSQDAVVQEALASGRAHLLFPGPKARDVATVPVDEPITLIVVDGTWKQAERLLKANPALMALPQLRFTPERPSDYNPIRREPAEHCVATIEALAYVLGHLERDPERFRALLRPFQAMVDMQLAYVRASKGGRHRLYSKRNRGNRRRLMPDYMREREARILCVHGEANTWPRSSGDRRPAEIVHWLARRLATGESFEAIVAPRRALSSTTPQHIRIASEELLAGEAWESFAARWQAFVRPDDVIVSWGHFPVDTLASDGLTLPKPRFDARALAGTWLRQRTGTVEDCLPRLQLPAPAPCGAGRGGLRLAGLCAVVRRMYERTAEIEAEAAAREAEAAAREAEAAAG